jgi:hypothetical protein
MLVSADDAAVDEMDGPIKVPGGIGGRLERGQELVPDPGPPPAIEPARHAGPLPVVRREVTPRCASSGNPEDAVHDGAVVMVGTPTRRALGWQERGEACPLGISQIVTSKHK